jgi:hypothetical protein
LNHEGAAQLGQFVSYVRSPGVFIFRFSLSLSFLSLPSALSSQIHFSSRFPTRNPFPSYTPFNGSLAVYCGKSFEMTDSCKKVLAHFGNEKQQFDSLDSAL